MHSTSQISRPSPVLIYKPQGVKDPELPNVAKDVFLLVIMTEFQATLFENFGGKISCIDFTHKTNKYRLKLLTIMVPDEYHNGTYVNKVEYSNKLQFQNYYNIFL